MSGNDKINGFGNNNADFYVKKDIAVNNLKNKGNNNPTLAEILNEMVENIKSEQGNKLPMGFTFYKNSTPDGATPPTEPPTEPPTTAPTTAPVYGVPDIPTEGPAEPPTTAPVYGVPDPETDPPTEPPTTAPVYGVPDVPNNPEIPTSTDSMNMGHTYKDGMKKTFKQGDNVPEGFMLYPVNGGQPIREGMVNKEGIYILKKIK